MRSRGNSGSSRRRRKRGSSSSSRFFVVVLVEVRGREGEGPGIANPVPAVKNTRSAFMTVSTISSISTNMLNYIID